MIYLDVYAWIMFVQVEICLLSDLIASGNRELLFRSHNALDLRKGQQERFRAFRPARDIYTPSALERKGRQRVFLTLYIVDAGIPDTRLHWRLHFIWWCLMIVGSQDGSCLMSPFWCLDF